MEMFRKILVFITICSFLLSCKTANPIEQLYAAFNQKKWNKVKAVLSRDFKGYSGGKQTTNYTGFYAVLYKDNVWQSSWKLISMTELGDGKFLVKGTFTDPYIEYLYGGPREGVWTYGVKGNKVVSIEWHTFPENPNQTEADKKETEFYDWIALNYPKLAGINMYESQRAAEIFRDLLMKYLEGRK